VQPRSARHVSGLLARLSDAAARDLLDGSWIKASTLEQGRLRVAEQLGRMQAGQRPAPPSDGRPDRFDDDRVPHRCSSALG
jgi:hypothetical protein